MKMELWIELNDDKTTSIYISPAAAQHPLLSHSVLLHTEDEIELVLALRRWNNDTTWVLSTLHWKHLSWGMPTKYTTYILLHFTFEYESKEMKLIVHAIHTTKYYILYKMLKIYVYSFSVKIFQRELNKRMTYIKI